MRPSTLSAFAAITLLSLATGPNLLAGWNDSTEFCTGNGMEKLWAQNRLSAPEMLAYIKDRHIRSPDVHTRIYVLDSGFDPSHLKDIEHPQDLELLPAVLGTHQMKDNKLTPVPGDPYHVEPSQVSLVGDPADDVAGHGMMVISTISAKGGMGVAPHAEVTLMRMTPSNLPGEADNTPDAFDDYAKVHACLVGRAANPEGVVIISESMSDPRQEESGHDYAKKHPAVVQALRDNGCLLIQAAGNASFRDDEDKAADLDQPILYVGSTGPFDNASSFTTTGAVFAPGESIYVLESRKAESPASDRNRCSEDEGTNSASPRRIVNGTSFSTPFTSGIASETLGVLETLHGPQLRSLHLPERAILLERILKASDEFGVINGLRAVMIAERWSGDLQSSASLRASLDETPAPICANGSPKTLAERFLVCASQKTPANAMALAKQNVKNSRFQSGAGYLRAAEGLGLSQETVHTAVLDYLNHFLLARYETSKPSSLGSEDAQGNLRRDLDAGMTPFVIVPYIEQLGARAQPVLKALLESDSAENYLRRGPGRGSEAILASLIQAVEIFEKAAGPAAVASLLDGLTDYRIAQLEPIGQSDINRGEQLVAAARVLNALYSHPELQADIRENDAKIILALGRFRTWFGNSESNISGLVELFHNEVYIFELFDREPELLAGAIKDPSHISEPAFRYALTKAPPKDPEFYLETMKNLDNGIFHITGTAGAFVKAVAPVYTGLDPQGQVEFVRRMFSASYPKIRGFSLVGNVMDKFIGSITKPLLDAVIAAAFKKDSLANLPGREAVKFVAESSEASQLLSMTPSMARFNLRSIGIYLKSRTDDPVGVELYAAVQRW